jgi:hypothetical protein
MRKSIVFGTIVGGNKGFIDYATSARKFLRYLPTTDPCYQFALTSEAFSAVLELELNSEN